MLADFSNRLSLVDPSSIRQETDYMNGTVNRKYLVLDCVFIMYLLAKCVAHNFHKQTESMDRYRTAAIFLVLYYTVNNKTNVACFSKVCYNTAFQEVTFNCASVIPVLDEEEVSIVYLQFVLSYVPLICSHK